jgi:hypothetical protein
MSILNGDGKPSCTRISSQDHRFTNNAWGLSKHDAWGWEEFMKHEDLDKKKHLKDDCLYILCDVTIDVGLHTDDYIDEIAATKEPKSVPPQLDLDDVQLAEAMNKQVADVKIKVSDRHTFPSRWWALCWPC